jgi:hypothetical protein
MRHHPNCPPGWENKCASSHCKSYGRGHEAGVSDVIAVLRKERDSYGMVDVDELLERYECGELLSALDAKKEGGDE